MIYVLHLCSFAAACSPPCCSPHCTGHFFPALFRPHPHLRLTVVVLAGMRVSHSGNELIPGEGMSEGTRVLRPSLRKEDEGDGTGAACSGPPLSPAQPDPRRSASLNICPRPPVRPSVRPSFLLPHFPFLHALNPNFFLTAPSSLPLLFRSSLPPPPLRPHSRPPPVRPPSLLPCPHLSAGRSRPAVRGGGGRRDGTER